MENFRIEVHVYSNLERLLLQEDLNRDYKITVEDLGPKCFDLHTLDYQKYTIRGTYFLSNLLQILAKAHQDQNETLVIHFEHIEENPVDALRSRIREEYWDALTRTLDEKGLLILLEDPKTKAFGSYNLYVPFTDPWSFKYFSSIAKKHRFLNLDVMQLPLLFTTELFEKLDKKPGLLSLAVNKKTKQGIPFVVPGGRFNEMYGWDSYFILRGLLEDGKINLARGLITNFAYQIRHYRGTLNANRTYFLSRSNPPFFTSMIRVFMDYEKSIEWLAEMLDLAISEYHEIWCHPDRLTKTGLNRFFGGRLKVPIEVERGHFQPFFVEKAKEKKISPIELEKLYIEGRITDPEIDEYFVHDRSMRESGHDTTNRLVGVSAHLVPIDLNSLLYKVESDIAYLVETYFNGFFKSSKNGFFTAHDWYEKAKKRRTLIFELLWDEEQGLFFDYNFEKEKPHQYESVTSMYPLFANLCDNQEASLLVENIIRLFEAPGGLLSTTKKSRGKVSSSRPQRQWDYPFGWAPHQILFWTGALNYGYRAIVERLAYKWLYMITQEAMNYAGVIVEKYHLIQRSHKARVEYGNEGINFQVYPKEGFGWVNASYQIGWSILSSDLKKALKELKAPEEIFK